MFLQINNLEKFYGEKDNRVQVLKGLSTGIGKGEICVLLGPSGSGKSTLLNIIGGIESYDKGEIIINGAAMSAMNEKQMTLYRCAGSGSAGPPLCLCPRSCDEAGDGLVQGKDINARKQEERPVL